MEYLVPILAVVLIGALTLAAARWLAGRPRQEAAVPGAPSVEPDAERARHAAGLLDESAHRAVYGHIAQNRPLEAIREFRRHTGRSLKDAVVDVQALAAHPQVYSAPAPSADVDLQDAEPLDRPQSGRDDDAEGPAPSVSEPTVQPDAAADRTAADPARGRRRGPEAAEVTELTIPSSWIAEPAPDEPPFEVEVPREGGPVRLSSGDLPPWLRDQLAAMVRDGNLESAAVQLSSHSSLTVPEAFEVLRRMRDRREGR